MGRCGNPLRGSKMKTILDSISRFSDVAISRPSTGSGSASIVSSMSRLALALSCLTGIALGGCGGRAPSNESIEPNVGKVEQAASANGASCTLASDCSSGYCDNTAHCAACTADGNCAQGSIGSAGGQYCSNTGVCTARKSDGAICSASAQCSGAGCYAARQCINGCCDGANVCHGYATGDKLCSSGRRCDDGNACHTGGTVNTSTNPKTCTGFTNLANGSSCNPDSSTCTTDSCSAGSCTHPAGNAGVVCRGAGGVCDVAESCNGSSGTCPTDAFAASGTECRAAAGACDVAESCTGASASCPADAKASAGTACPDDGDICTIDSCNGTGDTCQHTENPANADGDALSDCREDNDGNAVTDRRVFNGMDVRTKEQCSSVGSCAENDTYTEVLSCMVGAPAQELNQWSGWDWNNPPDNRCDPGYAFLPNWTSCSSTWQADWKGFIHFPSSGKQCFNITGGNSEGCAALYFNGNAGTADTQTGGTTKCFDVPAGAYPIEWHYTMDNGSSSSMHVNYCFGGASTCDPTVAVPYQMLTTQLLQGDRCSTASQCVSGLCLNGLCGAGFACAQSGDSDGDGTLDCLDGCPHDPEKIAPGDCGCSDRPRPSGTPCNDGLCAANTQCDGAGVCGDPAACPAPDANCRLVPRNGAFYWFCDDDRSFADARARCQSVGMDLPAIESADEDAFITSNITEHTYLSGTDQNVEGTWVWQSTNKTFWTGGVGGTAPSGAYANWEGSLQPSNTPAERDCMVKDSAGSGRWETRNCSDVADFACERPPVVAPPVPPIIPTPIPGGLIPVGPLCPPLLSMDAQGRVTFLPPPSTDPTKCATQSFCEPGTTQPLNPQPTADQINSPPVPGDHCDAVPPLPQCPADPATLTNTCDTDAQCAPGQICAISCSDPTCSTSEKRCGTPDTSKCGGMQADANCKTLWVCPDPDYTGDPTPVGDLSTHPTDPGADHPPASGMPQVYEPGNPCVLAVKGTDAPGGTLSVHQADQRAPRSGNSKWGITAEPSVIHNLDATALPLGEVSVNAEVSAGFKSDATIWSQTVNLVDAEIGAKVKDCELHVTRKFEIFGTPSTLLGNPPDFGTSTALQTACQTVMDKYTSLGNTMKSKLFDVKHMVDYVNQVGGVTPEFCDRTNQHFASITRKGYGGSALPNPIPCDQSAINAWIGAYRDAATDFVVNQSAPVQTSLNGFRDQVAAEVGGLSPTGGTFPFANIGESYDVTVIQAQLFIGPVPVAIEFGVRGSWGVDGSLDINLDHSGNAGGPTLGADVNVTPHADASAYGFAGVGISGFVEIGLTGNITLFGAEVPLHTGISLMRVQNDDPRDQTTSTVVDDPSAALMFPKVAYGWKAAWNFGAGLRWHTLDGYVGAMARIGISLGFVSFHITYETELARWNGFDSGLINLVGASYNVPVTGLPDFGSFEDEVVFPDSYPLPVAASAPSSATPVPFALDCTPPPR